MHNEGSELKMHHYCTTGINTDIHIEYYTVAYPEKALSNQVANLAPTKTTLFFVL